MTNKIGNEKIPQLYGVLKQIHFVTKTLGLTPFTLTKNQNRYEYVVSYTGICYSLLFLVGYLGKYKLSFVFVGNIEEVLFHSSFLHLRHWGKETDGIVTRKRTNERHRFVSTVRKRHPHGYQYRYELLATESPNRCSETDSRYWRGTRFLRNSRTLFERKARGHK